MRPASQKEDWASHSAGLALDANGTTCTVVQPPVDDPWWRADLGKDMMIEGFRILFSSQTFRMYSSVTVVISTTCFTV